MEMSFLASVWNSRNTNIPIEKTAFVLPSGRAMLRFKKEIMEQSSLSAISLPYLTSLNDLFGRLVPMNIPSGQELLQEMYACAKEQKFLADNFDDFLNYASMLQSDFSEIDQSLADTNAFFENLSQIKEIENWSLGGDNLSDNQKNLIDFWEKLGKFYEAYKARLSANGKAYSSMQVRLVAEHFEEWKPLPFEQIIFAGFNAFSTAEQKIVNQLCDLYQGQILWDTSSYYHQHGKHQAGMFLPPNKKPNVWVDADLGNRALEIETVGVSGATGQAVALHEIVAKIPKEEHQETAIVLMDESLLVPVLNHSVSAFENFNVSIALPHHHLHIVQLFELLIAVKKTSYASKGGQVYMSEPVWQLLACMHELGLCKKHSPELFLRNSTVSYLEFLLSEEALDFLQPWLKQKEMNAKSVEVLYELVQTPMLASNAEKHYQIKLTQSIAYWKKWLEENKEVCKWNAFKQLVSRDLANSDLFLEGKPFEGIQVLGLLETRGLDFKHVILLGAEEGKLPGVKFPESLIPYDLRTHFKLPGVQKKESLFAYYFYRLLHRSKHVHLLYNTASDDFNQAEKSRYLLQLSLELAKVNPNLKLTEREFAFPMGNDAKVKAENEIPKSEFVMERLHEWLERGVSPSAINTFVSCPLRFAHQTLLRLPDPIPKEILSASEMGSIIHKVLENVYQPWLGKPLSKVEVDASAIDLALQEGIIGEIGKVGARSNKVVFNRELALDRILSLINFDNQRVLRSKDPILLKGLELKLKKGFVIEGENVPYNLKGEVDRLEMQGNTAIVLDYKSGMVAPDALKGSAEKEIISNGKLFQLLTYTYLTKEEYKMESVSAGIYTLPNTKAPLVKADIDGRKVFDFSDGIWRQYRQELEAVLLEILNPDIPFSHHANAKYCLYC